MPKLGDLGLWPMDGAPFGSRKLCRGRGMFSLRKIGPEDKEMVRMWRNKDRIRRNMYNSDVISEEKHRLWFSKSLTDAKSKYLVFAVKKNPVGLIYFTEVDKENSTAKWGFYLGEDSSMPGIGTIMEYFAVSYAFEVLKMHKLCGEVLSYNSTAIGLQRWFGFKEEGVLRGHVFKEGSRADVHIFGMFRDEWFKEKARILKDLPKSVPEKILGVVNERKGSD